MIVKRLDRNVNRLGIPIFKVVIIGNSHCGKSSILLQFAENNFIKEHNTTIGVDLKSRYVKIGDTHAKLYVWDTAGQERFRSIVRTYYETASGIVLVFDLTDRKSFDSLEYWINELKRIGKSECPIIIVGNKSDMSSKRIITSNEINNFIKQLNLNIAYFESSAKSNINIDDIFIEITKKMLCKYNKIDDINDDNNATLSKILTRKESEILEIDNSAQSNGNVMTNGENAGCCVVS